MNLAYVGSYIPVFRRKIKNEEEKCKNMIKKTTQPNLNTQYYLSIILVLS